MVDTPIVSEALQKTFRDNFPSQVNSGRDLHVSDVVIPIVDFSTSTAVTGLRQDLQEAIDFNVTTFDVRNTTTTVLNTTGFWRVQAVSFMRTQTAVAQNNRFFLDDGTTQKDLFFMDDYVAPGGATVIQGLVLNFVVLLKAGVQFKIFTGNEGSRISGYCRQVADLSGTLQNPDGYTGS